MSVETIHLARPRFAGYVRFDGAARCWSYVIYDTRRALGENDIVERLPFPEEDTRADAVALLKSSLAYWNTRQLDGALSYHGRADDRWKDD